MQIGEIISYPDNETLGNEVQSTSDTHASGDEAQSAPDSDTPRDGAQSASGNKTPNDDAASILTAIHVPSGHTDQWYKKKPDLLFSEVAFMRERHPQAKYGFYPTSGDMFWKLELKVGQGLQPWTVVLRYEKDHPNNNNFGGSIKVIPIKPTFEEIQQQARDAGRSGVPHILSVKNGSEEYRCLCTPVKSDVYSGVMVATSAVMVAAWAAEWAAYFQLGLKRKDVWNKFCGVPEPYKPYRTTLGGDCP